MTGLHADSIDKIYVRIRDTFDHSDKIDYGVAFAKTRVGTRDGITEHYLIRRNDGTDIIHPVYACTEITKEEYFLGVLKG